MSSSSLFMQQVIATIKPIDIGAAVAARQRWDKLAKPVGSLGRLEEIVIQIAAIHGESPRPLTKRAIAVFAADNGVAKAEPISVASWELTALQAQSMAQGKASISAFARATGSDLFVYDVGVDTDILLSGVLSRRVARGTGNITTEPAMTLSQCVAAIEVGIQVAKDLAQQGYKVLVAGEMGIGNTTTSAALAARLTGAPLDIVVGKGTGLTEQRVAYKKEIVQRALDKHASVSEEDPIALLAALGGYDIAAMVGFYIGGASEGLPLVLDGYISVVAALLAYRIAAGVHPYFVASHVSEEPGYNVIADYMGLHPTLDMKMRLGEGTGAVLLLPILDVAVAAFNETMELEHK